MLTANTGEPALGERLKALMTSLPEGVETDDDWYAYWRGRFEELSSEMVEADRARWKARGG